MLAFTNVSEFYQQRNNNNDNNKFDGEKYAVDTLKKQYNTTHKIITVEHMIGLWKKQKQIYIKQRTCTL